MKSQKEKTRLLLDQIAAVEKEKRAELVRLRKQIEVEETWYDDKIGDMYQRLKSICQHQHGTRPYRYYYGGGRPGPTLECVACGEPLG